MGPRHLVLGQDHRLEAGRCDEEAAKLERQGWRCGFTPAKRNALKAKTDSSLATSAGTFVAAPKHWGLEWVWPARGWQSKELQDQGRLTMAWVPYHGGTHSVQRSLQPHGRSGLNAISRYWRRPAERSGDARGYGFWRAISTWNLRPLGNTPHPRDCQESWSNQRCPRSDTERRSDALITLWFTTQWLAMCGKCAYWKNQGSVLIIQFR